MVTKTKHIKITRPCVVINNNGNRIPPYSKKATEEIAMFKPETGMEADMLCRIAGEASLPADAVFMSIEAGHINRDSGWLPAVTKEDIQCLRECYA